MQDINSIIANNTGLIYMQMNRFHLYKDPDAESFAYEALYKAALTFNEAENVKFSTYATVCIYNALGCYIRKLNNKQQLDVISYNTVAYSDEVGDHEHEEFITNGITTEDEVLNALSYNELVDIIDQAVKSISNTKQRSIIAMYVNSDYTLSSKELASIIGVSQSYASQVLNIFKGDLRKRMEVQNARNSKNSRKHNGFIRLTSEATNITEQ